MTSVAMSGDVVRTADGTLGAARRADRMRQLKATGLVAPLFLFIMSRSCRSEHVVLLGQ
jgi:hypothetical protein